jgi:hypothetical protein
MARIPKPQTDLLIEYFERSQGTAKKPSVRVKGKQSSKSRLPGVNSRSSMLDPIVNKRHTENGGSGASIISEIPECGFLDGFI